MISYLGSLVQFSPAAGRAGRCRQKSLCVGSSRRVLAKQPAVLGASPLVLRAFSLGSKRLRWPEVCAPSPRVRCAFSLRGERPGKPGVWRPLHGHAAPFPSAAPARLSGLRESSDRTGGLFAGWEGVASLEFLSPFVLRTAGGVFRLVNFSLALPQFKKISLRLLSGPSGRSPP